MRCWPAVLLCSALAAPAGAGPPFVTDDPEPTEYRGFEVYFFAEATHADGATQGALPGIEINYGPLPDVQLSFRLARDFEKTSGGPWQSRYGGAALSAKYRFLHEDEDGWRPQLGFFPSVEVPSGGDPVRKFLPLWAQKSFGAWTTFGGGGYWINPGDGNRNYWFTGWAVLREITDHLRLGGEIFHQTADTDGAFGSITGAGVAALYDFSDHWHVVGSANRGLGRAHSVNEISGFIALELTM